MKLKQILAAQRRGMVFRPRYIAPGVLEREMELMQLAREGKLRGPEQTYNPEAPHFQRVPIVHGAPIPEAVLFQCVVSIAQAELRANASTYPSFKGRR